MPKRKLKIYLDSTIPNYAFNAEYPEKQKASKKLFELGKQGKVELLISPVTLYEINGAQEERRDQMLKIVNTSTTLEISTAAEDLADEYIKQSVFTKANEIDAQHVGYGVYYGADVIASYNFKHIVRISTIKKLQSVNLILGYTTPEIRTPEELLI